jgi:hypothetical protein
VFPVFILFIGIITIGLVTTIKKDKNAKSAESLTNILLALSICVTLAAGGYIGQKIYNKIKTNDVSEGYVSPSPNPSLASSSGSDNSPLFGG